MGEVQGCCWPTNKQCVAGACSSVWGHARHAWSGWWAMTDVQKLYPSWNCKTWKKLIVSDESTSCLFATRPTCMWGDFLEKDSSRSA